MTTVVEYIVERLAKEGIEHCFGVPGDYSFPVCDAVEKNQKVQWIGCANELNAAYAADGYARVRGAAMLSTTYAVGELSALNGVMGAKAEHSLVYHVVGMPSVQNDKLRKIMHHTFGDGIFGNFVNISAQAACVHAVIDPDNCALEMERVIAAARRYNQPAYICVASDYAQVPCNLTTTVTPIVHKSCEAALKRAVSAISARIATVKSLVVLPSYTLSRLHLQAEAKKLIDAWGCPFATTTMEKGLFDESHPLFAGMYSGAISTGSARQLVDGADVVLDLGGVSLNDENTAGFSNKLDDSKMLTIGLNETKVGAQIFSNVRLYDMIHALAELKIPIPRYSGKHDKADISLPGKAADKITMEALYPRYAAFLRSGDNVVLETGSSTHGFSPIPLKDGVQVHLQMLWGSIGWATPAAFGVALANKQRTILITGEGSHQLTANELGSMARYNAKPIIFCLNNDGYLIERALEAYPDWSYNDLAKWRFADVPKAMGCADWFVARVETLGELDAAMKATRDSKSGSYIEIIAGRMDMPSGLAFAHTRLKEMYGETP